MSEFEAGTIEVRGQQMQVWVTDRGAWLTRFAGRKFVESTKDSLRDRMMKVTAKQVTRVSVLFDRLEYDLGGGSARIRRCEAVGVHQGNNNLLVREQVAGEWGAVRQDAGRLSYRGDLTPLDFTQRATYLRLLDARRDAQQAVSRFEDEHKLDVRKAVEAALEEAVKDAS